MCWCYAVSLKFHILHPSFNAQLSLCAQDYPLQHERVNSICVSDLSFTLSQCSCLLSSQRTFSYDENINGGEQLKHKRCASVKDKSETQMLFTLSYRNLLAHTHKNSANVT